METITETTLLQATTAAAAAAGAEQAPPEVKEVVETMQEAPSASGPPGGSPAHLSSQGEQRLSQGQSVCFSTVCVHYVYAGQCA